MRVGARLAGAKLILLPWISTTSRDAAFFWLPMTSLAYVVGQRWRSAGKRSKLWTWQRSAQNQIKQSGRLKDWKRSSSAVRHKSRRRKRRESKPGRRSSLGTPAARSCHGQWVLSSFHKPTTVRLTNLERVATSETGEFALLLPPRLQTGDPMEISMGEEWVVVSPFEG
jgi:hypothetical protein